MSKSRLGFSRESTLWCGIIGEPTDAECHTRTGTPFATQWTPGMSSESRRSYNVVQQIVRRRSLHRNNWRQRHDALRPVDIVRIRQLRRKIKDLPGAITDIVDVTLLLDVVTLHNARQGWDMAPIEDALETIGMLCPKCNPSCKDGVRAR